jgi:DegV family protein with EDD domain
VTIRIVTDTISDIPPEIAAEMGITVIPNYINVGRESFLDGVTITRREYYERLPHWSTPPTTAAPGIDTFHQAYEHLAAEGATAIISLHVFEKLSNLCNVARLGAAATHSVPVMVVPGPFLSLAGGFAVMAAAQAIRQNCSLPEVLAVIKDISARTHLFAALETLEYLRRSGRVSNLLARVGDWL